MGNLENHEPSEIVIPPTTRAIKIIGLELSDRQLAMFQGLCMAAGSRAMQEDNGNIVIDDAVKCNPSTIGSRTEGTKRIVQAIEELGENSPNYEVICY